MSLPEPLSRVEELSDWCILSNGGVVTPGKGMAGKYKKQEGAE